MILKNKNKEIEYIRELAKELIEISGIKKEKYPFREECIDKLTKKMKINPGKFLIYLEDLPDYCTWKFNEKGKNILNKLLSFVKDNYGLDRINRKYGINFYLINDSVNKRNIGLQVRTIKKYIKFLAEQELNILNIGELNKSVTQIKSNISSKAIQINGLPIDLRNEKWAPIFGIILDSYLKKRFIFVAEDRKFAEYMISSFRKVGIEPYFKNQGNLVKIDGYSIISHILRIGGIKTNTKQLIANNHLPPWMFLCSKKYHAILLSKFLDTEGYVPKGNKGIRIAQASFVELTKDERDFVLSNGETKIIKPNNKKFKTVVFSKLDENLKKKSIIESTPDTYIYSITFKEI